MKKIANFIRYSKYIDLNKHIYEGWTVRDFVDHLRKPLEQRMRTNPIKTKSELKKWCMDNQPHIKKYIPEVVNYFSEAHNIKTASLRFSYDEREKFFKNEKDFKSEKYKDYFFMRWTATSGNASGKPVLVVYKGKQFKPLDRAYYNSEERVNEVIKEYKNRADRREKEKQEQKDKKKNFKHTLKVGDIFVSSWGYDQTNVDFYMVTKVISDKSVEIQGIGSKIVRSEGHENLVVPDKTKKYGEPMRKLVTGSADSMYVNVGYHSASLWSGRPARATASGYGH